MKTIEINGEIYVSKEETDKMIDRLKEEIAFDDKLLKYFCPFTEDDYAKIENAVDIRYLTEKYKRIGKITKKSRADYETEINDLRTKLGAMKIEVTKARKESITKKYGDGFVSTLKRIKEELNKIDFDNMTGSMNL